MGTWYRRYQIIPKGEKPVPIPSVSLMCRNLRPEALASRKACPVFTGLVCCKAWSEGSESANPGSNEQELDTEAGKVG